jgi:hypothetical protein
MADLAPYELMSLHEWTSACTQTVKRVRQELNRIQDPQLKQMAQQIETNCERSITRAEQLLSAH